MAAMVASAGDGGPRGGDQRLLQADSMSHFVKTQMMVILQPFIDTVQQLDAGLDKLTERLNQTDGEVAKTRRELDTTNGHVKDLRADLKSSNTRVSSLGEGLAEVGNRTEMLQKGLELTNEFSQRIHNMAQSIDQRVPELDHTVEEIQAELQALKVNQQRLSDCVSDDVQKLLDKLGSDLKDLDTNRLQKCEADLGQLKQKCSTDVDLWHTARESMVKNNSETQLLMKNFQDFAKREAELSNRIEGWKVQWSKLHPAVDALKKDISFLKTGHDGHDAMLHGLQRGMSSAGEAIEDIRGQHVALGNEVEKLQQGAAVTNQALAETREALHRGTAFSNNLHSKLEQATGDVRQANIRLDGLEQKHFALCDAMDRTNNGVAELAAEHRKGNNSAQAMQRELDRTNDALNQAKNQLDNTSRGLNNLKGDLDHTKEAVDQLDKGLELCRAGFSGVQRGLVDTGAHSARHVTLPKLAKAGGGSPEKASTAPLATPRTWVVEEHAAATL